MALAVSTELSVAPSQSQSGGRAVSYDNNAPPGSPAANSTYIVGSAPTAAFTGHAHKAAFWNGSAWSFSIVPTYEIWSFEQTTQMRRRTATGWEDYPKSAGATGHIPPVLALVNLATQSPGTGLAAAAAGQRYALNTAGTPHAGWGTITGGTPAVGDILEYKATNWTIDKAASTLKVNDRVTVGGVDHSWNGSAWASSKASGMYPPALYLVDMNAHYPGTSPLAGAANGQRYVVRQVNTPNAAWGTVTGVTNGCIIERVNNVFVVATATSALIRGEQIVINRELFEWTGSVWEKEGVQTGSLPPVTAVVPDVSTSAPGVGLATAADGQRYALNVVTSFHANWGPITGGTVAAGCIIERVNNNWVVATEAARLTVNQTVRLFSASVFRLYRWSGTAWAPAGESTGTYPPVLSTVNITAAVPTTAVEGHRYAIATTGTADGSWGTVSGSIAIGGLLEYKNGQWRVYPEAGDLLANDRVSIGSTMNRWTGSAWVIDSAAGGAAIPVTGARAAVNADNGREFLLRNGSAALSLDLSAVDDGWSARVINEHTASLNVTFTNANAANYRGEIRTAATSPIALPPGAVRSLSVSYDGANRNLSIRSDRESPRVITLTDGATVAVDAQNSTSVIASLVANGNRTIAAPTNVPDGGRLIIVVTANGASRFATFNTVYKRANGSDLSATAMIPSGSTAAYLFVRSGANYILYGNEYHGAGLPLERNYTDTGTNLTLDANNNRYLRALNSLAGDRIVDLPVNTLVGTILIVRLEASGANRTATFHNNYRYGTTSLGAVVIPSGQNFHFIFMSTSDGHWHLVTPHPTAGSVYKGEWVSGGTAYSVGHVVSNTRRHYRCIVAHTSAATIPGQDNTNWDELSVTQVPVWTANTKVFTGEVRSLNGRLIAGTSDRTTRASFDLPEGSVWTALGGYQNNNWATGRWYPVGDFAVFNGQLYLCKTLHIASAAFATDNANWDPVGGAAKRTLLTAPGTLTVNTEYLVDTSTAWGSNQAFPNNPADGDFLRFAETNSAKQLATNAITFAPGTAPASTTIDGDSTFVYNLSGVPIEFRYKQSTNRWESIHNEPMQGETTGWHRPVLALVNVTQAPPNTAQAGHRYAVSTIGTPEGTWGTISGTVAVGCILQYSGSVWSVVTSPSQFFLDDRMLIGNRIHRWNATAWEDAEPLTPIRITANTALLLNHTYLVDASTAWSGNQLLPANPKNGDWVRLMEPNRLSTGVQTNNITFAPATTPASTTIDGDTTLIWNVKGLELWLIYNQSLNMWESSHIAPIAASGGGGASATGQHVPALALVNITAAVPATAQNGHRYVVTTSGTPHASWGTISGTVALGCIVQYGTAWSVVTEAGALKVDDRIIAAGEEFRWTGTVWASADVMRQIKLTAPGTLVVNHAYEVDVATAWSGNQAFPDNPKDREWLTFAESNASPGLATKPITFVPGSAPAGTTIDGDSTFVYNASGVPVAFHYDAAANRWRSQHVAPIAAAEPAFANKTPAMKDIAFTTPGTAALGTFTVAHGITGGAPTGLVGIDGYVTDGGVVRPVGYAVQVGAAAAPVKSIGVVEIDATNITLWRTADIAASAAGNVRLKYIQ